MLVLGIESSCDETAAAVVADGERKARSREHERLYREEFTRLAVHSLTRSTTRHREEPPKEAPRPVSDEADVLVRATPGMYEVLRRLLVAVGG